MGGGTHDPNERWYCSVLEKSTTGVVPSGIILKTIRKRTKGDEGKECWGKIVTVARNRETSGTRDRSPQTTLKKGGRRKGLGEALKGTHDQGEKRGKLLGEGKKVGKKSLRRNSKA